MELNGVIKTTTLTPDVFQIQCDLVYEGKEATAAFVMESTKENITEMLKVSGKPCWEQLPNTPVKLRLVDEEGGPRLDAIGHFLIEYWLVVPREDEEMENS